MKVEIRSKICSTCPWKKENAHQLKKGVIKDMLRHGVISPCHQELEKVTGSCTEGVEIYAEKAEIFKVCKGYADAVAGCEQSGMVGMDYINET